MIVRCSMFICPLFIYPLSNTLPSLPKNPSLSTSTSAAVSTARSGIWIPVASDPLRCRSPLPHRRRLGASINHWRPSRRHHESSQATIQHGGRLSSQSSLLRVSHGRQSLALRSGSYGRSRCSLSKHFRWIIHQIRHLQAGGRRWSLCRDSTLCYWDLLIEKC